jgi:uncharacterized protein (TIGR02300 family)
MDAARKVKLGQRWVCYVCEAKFYDLNRAEPICPKCKADQRESPVFAKPKRARAKKAAPQAPAPAVEPIVEDTLRLEDDADESDGVADEETSLDDDVDED